jgi:hypothetical protein
MGTILPFLSHVFTPFPASGTTPPSQPARQDGSSTLLRNVQLPDYTGSHPILNHQHLPFSRRNYSKVLQSDEVGGDKKFYVNRVHRAFIIVLRDS